MSADRGFRRMVNEFGDGLSDVIIMHIDTAKLLDPKQWDLLKEAGASAIVVHKSLPEDGP